MKNKINPYTTLLNEFREWCYKAHDRHAIIMWHYPKDKLATESWRLLDLFERVAAAKQIGYDVELRATDAGLEVWYIKQLPEIPWRVK